MAKDRSEENRARAKRWHEEHREQSLRRQRRYYREHVVEFRASARRRYHANRDHHLARMWARETRLRAIGMTWGQRNPDGLVTKVIRRRARLAGAIGGHTTRQWLEKVALFGGCCAYCGEARPLSRDHRIPLSRGGTNAIANIVPACRSCNSSKRDRTDREFIAARAA